MSKAKKLGNLSKRTAPFDRQRQHFARRVARDSVAAYDPSMTRLWGGVDSGCLQQAVAAGIKHKKK